MIHVIDPVDVVLSNSHCVAILEEIFSHPCSREYARKLAGISTASTTWWLRVIFTDMPWNVALHDVPAINLPLARLDLLSLVVSFPAAT